MLTLPTLRRLFAPLFLLLALLLAACGQAQPSAPAAGGETPADLLAAVKARGRLLVSTDANYAPQSFKNSDGGWEGFDIEVATEVARRMGVEVEFLDIAFDVITAGAWNGRWDVNVGSMTVTAPRKEVLTFTTPYYYTPAAVVVHTDSTLADASALAGATIGVGAGTTYLDYLNGELVIEGEEIRVVAPADAVITTYDTDILALDDLALGDGARLNAVITALPTAQQAIADGKPLKILGDPVYYEPLAVALDNSSTLPVDTLAAEITRILEEMRSDGTLKALSEKYYGVDITSKVE